MISPVKYKQNAHLPILHKLTYHSHRTYEYPCFRIKIISDVLCNIFADSTYMTTSTGGFLFNTTWVGTPNQQEYKFSVKACEEVMISLTAVPKTYHTLAYLVTLGAGANNQTTISEKYGQHPVVTEATPDVLDCDKYRLTIFIYNIVLKG